MESRVTSLEQRVDAMEKRFDKVDMNLQRIWERIDSHREGQVRTQTLVEEVGKDMTELRIGVGKIIDASGSKWEQLWSKGFWFIIGLVGAFIMTQVKG